MRYFVIMMLAAGLVGCGDDGGDDGQSVSAAFDYDYGVDPSEYPDQCKSSEDGVSAGTLEATITDQEQTLDLPSVTQCRDSAADWCADEGATVYGEEGYAVEVELKSNMRIEDSLFQLVYGDEVIGERSVEGRVYDSSNEFVRFELPPGRTWPDGLSLVASATAGEYEVIVNVESRVYFVDRGCE